MDTLCYSGVPTSPVSRYSPHETGSWDTSGYISLNKGQNNVSPGQRKSNSPPTRVTPISRGQSANLSRSTPVIVDRGTPLKDPLVGRGTPGLVPPLESRNSQHIDGSSRQGSASPGDTLTKLETPVTSSGGPTRLGSPFWCGLGSRDPQSRTFEFPERDVPLTSSQSSVRLSSTNTPPTYKHVTNLLIDKVGIPPHTPYLLTIGHIFRPLLVTSHWHHQLDTISIFQCQHMTVFLKIIFRYIFIQRIHSFRRSFISKSALISFLKRI